jgi:6-pyruvoyltetrahydropterin/6-carboxytetrahydropterin synthase
MYELTVKSGFSGAHNLRGYKGRCEELHGHNWRVEARFAKERLDDIGLSVDFKVLKRMLNNIIRKLDHSYLNKVGFFRKRNPSAENIARFIFDGLKGNCRKKGITVVSVSVWESEGCCATYRE